MDYFKQLDSIGLKGISLDKGIKEWDWVLNKLVYIPVNYMRCMIEYQQAYMECFHEEYTNLSMVLYSGDEAIGIWPLSIRRDNHTIIVGSNEGPVIPPLFIGKFGEKGQKSIIDRCIAFLELLTHESGQDYWKGLYILDSKGIDLWHRKLMENGAKIEVKHEVYIDLSLNINEIKSNFRKSYHSLISKGLRTWKVDIFKEVDENVFAAFQELHLKAAGRLTRNKESWNLQRQAVNNGNAFLITIRDQSGIMIGGSLFYISRDEGLYAVGAYERSLFDQPLGHVAQIKAIEYMKELGLKWYRIGERPYSGDYNNPTEKELNIGYFKEGFATNTFLKLLTTNQLKDKK